MQLVPVAHNCKHGVNALLPSCQQHLDQVSIRNGGSAPFQPAVSGRLDRVLSTAAPTSFTPEPWIPDVLDGTWLTSKTPVAEAAASGREQRALLWGLNESMVMLELYWSPYLPHNTNSVS
jgi:hypothetical protein